MFFVLPHLIGVRIAHKIVHKIFTEIVPKINLEFVPEIVQRIIEKLQTENLFLYFCTIFWDDITIIWDENIVHFFK